MEKQLLNDQGFGDDPQMTVFKTWFFDNLKIDRVNLFLGNSSDIWQRRRARTRWAKQGTEVPAC